MQVVSIAHGVDEFTYFTENYASVIDLLFVANTESLLLLDVGEPCLNLNMCYSCPVYGVF